VNPVNTAANSTFAAKAAVTRLRDRPVRGRRESATGLIDLRPLLGVWVNYDETSTGIHRIEISAWEGIIPTVRAFGAGRTAPHDWGEVAGAAFADGVGTTEAVAFTANYDLGFATVLLAGYLNKRLLVADAYTTFTDSSGRAGYFQRDHLYLP
jgi:hypothetical protein